jgi:putative ABC transport system substrate-binding protein
VTALSYLNEEISGKRLELLKELLPALARVAVLRNPNAQSHATFWKETEVAARKLGATLLPLDIRGPDDFEAVFAAAKRGNALARVPNGAAYSYNLHTPYAALHESAGGTGPTELGDAAIRSAF